MKPGFWQVEIQKALKERKQKQAMTQNKFITMNQDMLSLITNSMHVSTGKFTVANVCLATRGKALSLLNNVSHKRSREFANA